ncbi:sulfatase-like hydrolase/transferase [Streptomyces sp. NPDC046925]|uniref:sulfatase-like hydrolase/transferase n=1 Tax=Streptomyces sp. NPDC046925 TaxID=3155375 RepID=UPI0033F6A697
MPNRRQFLTGSAAALGMATLPARPASADPGTSHRAPNIVVILADDLGYGELGAYGQRLIATPRLDRLSAQGLRFDQAYAAAAVCAPSRCSLLTGLHGGHAAVRQNPFDGPQGSIGDDDTTFAEVLRARGYRTACIGKWGFGPDEADQPSHPNNRGFEEFFGYIGHGHAHEYFPAYLWHNGAKTPLPQNEDGKKGAYAIDLIERHALDFIDDHSDEPFLLFLTPNIPHAPSDITDTSQYDDRPWPAADKGHAAQVSRLDTLVGNVVDRLAKRGIDRHTLVLATSDNGPHEEGGLNPDLFDANGPLRGYKRNLYEGGVRVPLIAWQPGTVPHGTTDRPTPLIDLLPTLAELGGAPAPRDIDGLSAAALLNRTPTKPPAAKPPLHSHLYWSRNDPGSTKRANAVDKGRILKLAEAVRKGDLKAVRFAPARDRTAPDSQWQLELYDLAADPGETNDIAAAHPATVTELTALLRSSWTESHHREAFGISIHSPELSLPGQQFTVTVTFGNSSAHTWTDARLRLDVPDRWRARPASPRTADRLKPGSTLTATWDVTAPADVAPGSRFPLRAEATATYDGKRLHHTSTRTTSTPPPPPTADGYLSDLDWVSATNGWGPVERDTSNGKKPAADGTPISFGGTVYSKGLGVHAPSEIVYYLGGNATRLTAVVGIDDFSAHQNSTGGTRARIFGDGVQLFDSGPLTAAGGPKGVDTDVSGVRLLRLVVEDANNNTSYDHTSWAAAYIKV